VLDRLLPRSADNSYRGHRVALWLFGLILLMKSVIGVRSIFDGEAVARSADGIPIDSFTPAGARAVVSLFGLLGVSQLMFCLLGILVLARYRTLVPALFAVMLLGHLGGRLFLRLMPIPRTGRPPAALINLVFLALMVGGLALSLWRRGESRA
jgi:hypothetical protein